VRQVLELVARGEAEAGIVYETDVLARHDVFIVGEPPTAAAPHIRYQLGRVVRDGSGADGAAVDRVGRYLCGPEGHAWLLAAGFSAP
jgi:ABC-type molybdate transport system substrate-binding protein